MERPDWMSVDQLWFLHQLVISELIREMTAEKRRLDARLRELGEPARRHHPEVIPKYRNPARQSETWAGRGETSALVDCAATVKCASGERLAAGCNQPTPRPSVGKYDDALILRRANPKVRSPRKAFAPSRAPVNVHASSR